MSRDQLSPSEKLYQEALKVLPGGVSRNTVFRRPHPFYAARAEGAYLYDLDGIRRIDFANNMASLIHGHAYPPVVAAVTEQLPKGSAYTMATEVEVRFAQLLCARVPSFEKVRFVNSGTEGVMSCIKAARAFTGRRKIAKAEGAYHGGYDFAEVSQTANPANWGKADRPDSVPVATGTPQGVLDDVLIIPFNDSERALAILNESASDIACVLIDPMPHRVGLVPATHDFIESLRRWCDEHDALLVFDEVITFRSSYTGAQGWYDAKPDLTAIGKMIGGGFPIGALAGRNEVMEVLDPRQERLLYPHSGTFSANPITMTAGLVTMKHFDEVAVERLNSLAEYTKQTINEAIKVTGVAACVSGGGSMLRVHLKDKVPTGYRCAYLNPLETKMLHQLNDELYANDIMMINTCSFALSTVMTENDIESLGRVFVDAFNKVKGFI
ncbi:MAG: aspartate aminotransferase family protein [Pirellulales bacterium]